jgi:hypothetical protein
MNDHSAWQLCVKHMLALLEILATTKTTVERKNRRERGVILRGKNRFEKVTGETSQQWDRCPRCGGMGHGFHNCRAPKTPS